MSKTWKDYQCIRCGINRKVKRYVFAEDGLLHEANLCECCADEGGVMQLAKDYLHKQELLKYGTREQNIEFDDKH